MASPGIFAGQIMVIITWAGRYCLVKGGRHILYDQGGIRQIISPAGRHTVNYAALRGGIR